MPISKNRKGHRKRVINRNKQITESKNRINNAYKEMYEELRTKSTSVPDMLNKEDNEQSSPIEISHGYLDARTDEERAKDEELSKSAIVTTNAIEEEYIVLSDDNN